MQVALRFGIEATNSVIAEFDGEHVLIVERFDRFNQGNTIGRVHQEDLAQATGTPHVQKYETDGGPGYQDIFTVFDRNLSARDARDAKERFAKLLVFSWIIAHNDGHAKNYSLTHIAGRSVLAPFYDLNSAIPFKLPEQVLTHEPALFDNVELAITVDGANTLGTFGVNSIHRLQEEASLQKGSLRDFALGLAAYLQPTVAAVIDELPERLREIPAVKLYPHGTFTQAKRVLKVLG